MSRRTLPTVLLAVFALPLAGCGFFKSLAGTNTVDLEGADVQSMGVDIRKKQKTICPREPVQMAVFMEVKKKGAEKPVSVETWEGRGSVNKNDKLDFADFAFHSDVGTFDPEGWLTPNPDLRTTLADEIAIKAVWKKQPDKFTFDTKYKPSYGCITGPGRSGPSGASAKSGIEGSQGQMGSSGGSSSPGGNGGDGQPGQRGGNGGDGGDGPRLTLVATLVKTAFYDQLVAVRVTGDADDFLLFPIDTPIAVRASGGSGGQGGPGGRGGNGGSGGSGNPGGRGGNGGRGGDGGVGGRGGRGGDIDLTIDPRHLATLGPLFQLDVGGGRGGSGGAAGPGGMGGGAGSGVSSSSGSSHSGQAGASGPQGASGQAGVSGAPGRSNVHPGDVASAFADVRGLTVLGGAEPPKDPPKDAPKRADPPKKPAKGAKP